jgi:hypothetical protein
LIVSFDRHEGGDTGFDVGVDVESREGSRPTAPGLGEATSTANETVAAEAARGIGMFEDMLARESALVAA